MIRFNGFDEATQFKADGPCSVLVIQWNAEFIYLWHPDHSEGYPSLVNGKPFAGWRTKLRGPYPALLDGTPAC